MSGHLDVCRQTEHSEGLRTIGWPPNCRAGPESSLPSTASPNGWAGSARRRRSNRSSRCGAMRPGYSSRGGTRRHRNGGDGSARNGRIRQTRQQRTRGRNRIRRSNLPAATTTTAKVQPNRFPSRSSSPDNTPGNRNSRNRDSRSPDNRLPPALHGRRVEPVRSAAGPETAPLLPVLAAERPEPLVAKPAPSKPSGRSPVPR